MTDEEYLRACGWDQRGAQFWARPKDADGEFAEVLAVEDAVSEQLAEDRDRHNFMLARSRRHGGFMFARDGAPDNVEAYGAGVPTVTTPDYARRLFGEPMYAPDGAPSNASAAAIEALKMQRPVVTVNVAEPLTGKPTPRPSALSEWAENQGRWVRNWTSMPAGRVAVAVTLDERTGLWTGNSRAFFVSPGDARDAVDDLLRKQGLL